MKKWKKLACLILMVLITVGSLFATGGGQQQTQAWRVSRAGFNPSSFPRAPADYTITILTISHTGDMIAADHPAIRALEQLTGYKIKLEYVLNANYNEMMNTRLASRNLPGLVTTAGNTLPIVQAAQWGAFWDITEIYDLYPNLARADKNIMSNISIEGRNFGIYRARDWPRSGFIYREDWLQKVGLQPPKTLTDLYNVLKAFTENDPDGNGVKDTFGMNWTGFHMGPFHNIAVWHGAPNRFGVRNGQLTPWFEYDEFYQAMVYSKRLYDEGLINRDFAATSTSDWALAFGRGQAGFHIDVADEARRSGGRLRDNGIITQAQFDQAALIGVGGLISNGSNPPRVFPQNDGHGGYVAISTVGARTLQDLHYHLDFMDKLNTVDGITILNNGAEGVNFTRNSDNTITTISAAQITGGRNIVEGLNQFRMLQDIGRIVRPVAYDPKINAVLAEVQPYAVVNPVTPIALLSPTWTARSQTLNQLIDDAVINFIIGNIDRAGWEREKQRWYTEYGQTALNELQAAYNTSRR